MRETQSPSRPAFVVDPNSTGSTQGRQISWAHIPEKYRRGAQMVKLNGAVLADAEELTVDALAAEVPGGRVLNFGGGLTAVVTETAAALATTIAVEPVAADIADNAEAWYQPAGQESAGKVLPAGKVMVEVTGGGGKLATRAERPNAETASQMLKTRAVEDSTSDSLSGYGTYDSGRFFENLLPDADPATGLIPTAFKTELRAAGGAWRFEQYANSM